LIGRKWIDARNMTREDFIKFANNLDAALVKPLKGMQGKGIYKVSLNSEESINSVYKECAGKDYIIEEIIEQCEETRKFNPSSVNTIRVYSVFYNGQVIITGAVQRMGNGDTVCDNYSSGGLAASIDVESGIIISRAVSKNNESLYIHPYTNMVIIGTQIPRWCDVIATVKAAHQLISGLRYVAWDVVVCNNGKIALLEANTGGGVGILQHPTLVGVNPIYKKYMKNIER
jgi:hypothetical protein